MSFFYCREMIQNHTFTFFKERSQFLVRDMFGIRRTSYKKKKRRRNDNYLSIRLDNMVRILYNR